MPPFFGANQRLMPSPRQMIISIVPFQRIHKIRNLRVPIDHQALHSRNFRKMPGMCRRQSLAKPRMMRGSREDPGSSRHLEVGIAPRTDDVLEAQLASNLPPAWKRLGGHAAKVPRT